jgi:hypothetical protein
MSDKDRAIEMLWGTAEGDYAAHVWRSPQFPGADMLIRYTGPDAEVDPTDHGLPTSFAADVELEYAGTLSREAAIHKLQNMRIAASEIGYNMGAV